MKFLDQFSRLNVTTRTMVTQAMLAALYVALTVGIYNLSYGPIQLRISEFMLIFVLVNRKNAIGIIIGTFIANLIGAYGVLDMVVGTGATALVCILMMIKQPLMLSYLWPTIINAVVIGFMLSYLEQIPFWVSASQVGIGEFLVTALPFIIVGKRIMENQSIQRLFT